MTRLAAAMSGGVDSSVAAALAVREGHEVVGITLKQWEFDDEATRLSKGCCTLDAVADARRAADVLGIPHYTLDMRETFTREVVEPFVDSYATGRTPNPCIRCNERVRFGAFLERALRLGFDAVITGHYARLARAGDRVRLRRARASEKDQSYVLHALGQDALRRIRFPLGDMPSKHDVRVLAHELGLPNADREDSVEVCFVGEDRRPGDVVAERRPDSVRPGAILDTDGREVGRHEGLAYYTVGQRRGLGNLAVAPARPRYVTRIDPDRNTLVVGGSDDLGASGLEARDARWVAGEPPAHGARLAAVLRYQGEEVPARILLDDGGGFRLDFERPARAVAPGQSVVLYDSDEVIGGGTITRPR